MHGTSGHITSSAYDKLPPILVRSSDGHAQGHGHLAVLDESVPTLEQVLDLVSEHEFSHKDKVECISDSSTTQPCVIIEVKQDSQLLVQLVHAQLVQRNLHRSGTVAWFSLKAHIHRRLTTFDGHMTSLAPISELLQNVVLFHLGVLPLYDMWRHDDSGGFNILGIVADKVNIGMAQHNIPGFTRLPLRLQHVLIEIADALLASPRFVKYFRDRGVPVFALGVNNEVNFLRSVAKGATAVLTDDPDWTHDYLTARAADNIPRGGLAALPTSCHRSVDPGS
eukprot:m.258495 g.258495  ORF g.258495 m.258495 type:complete len:280 (+) comp19644_c0_seq5:1034-1873(+)